MELHILSLFPESIRPYLESSIMKRAQEKGLFRYMIHNLTDWSVRNTRRVDDHPYGGGPGTIITIEPITYAIRDIVSRYGPMDAIIYFSPRGVLHDQIQAETYGQRGEKYIIICGHYEGIDERVFELFDIREISIGQYVLSSGEIASLVWIDSVVRLIPGVISPESLAEESYSPALLRKKEYPHYSRPSTFENISVPTVLLSGDKEKIRTWNHAQIQD